MKAKLLYKSIDNSKLEFEKIFNSFYPALCLFANSIIGNNLISEDIVQEVFVSLWEKSYDFNHPKAIKSFLYTSVKNKCINHLEHSAVVEKHKNIAQQILMNTVEINNQLIEEETHRLIYNAINELPNQCKNVLLLGLSGLKNEQIAAELQISINTVKTQKKIAYKQLKIKLKDVYALVGILLGNIL